MFVKLGAEKPGVRMPIKLVVTIDVEEEGLFSNRYDPHNRSVTNVRQLVTLDATFQEFGIRPCLMVTYPVITHGPSADLLNALREKWRGEIGAHLHYWNTPPLTALPDPAPVPSESIPGDLLTEKLHTLLDAIRARGTEPTAFRMGRFNFGSRMLSVLEKAGISVDSSVAPMRRYYGGPDHLAARTDPYFPDPTNVLAEGNSKVLEVPMTILPVFKGLGGFLERLRRRSMIPEGWISWLAMNVASLSAQPMGTGLRRLQAAARLHLHRGGRVVTIFFHSSELVPRGSPQHQTLEDVERFRRRIHNFLGWLRNDRGGESVTLTELGEQYGKDKWAQKIPSS